MTAPPLATLTEKEREALRLVLAGHEAKSAARELDLSVHAVNDRLRSARRKLGVTSSKAAARALAEDEGAPPEPLAHEPMGDAESAAPGPLPKPRPRTVPGRVIAGVAVMIFLATLGVLALSQQTTTQGADAEQVALDHATEDAARAWLAHVDAGDWEASYRLAGSQFQELNTLALWSETSEQARTPLGSVTSRGAIGYDHVAAPPRGYREVTFRTDFAGKPGATESVTLAEEGGEWRVVGYIIE